MTLRVAVFGAAGRMGRAVMRAVLDDPDASLAAAIDRSGGGDAGVLVGGEPLGVPLAAELTPAGADVVIDFSLPAAMPGVLAACVEARVPLVSGTTGLGADALAQLDAAADRVPIVWAPNFSQGVTLLFHLASEATRRLGPAFDAEIVELHHRRKVDAPSGTALRLAEAVGEARGLGADAFRHGRSGTPGARPGDEIGIHAVRGGDVVGEHTLYFFAEGERLELTHRATDRSLFARGALRAAHWAKGRPPGRYDMFDVMGLR